MAQAKVEILINARDNTQSAVRSVTQSIRGIGNVALGAASAGVAALGAGVAKMAVDGVRGAIDLEQQVANIGAVMGRTADDIVPVKDLIKDLAVNPSLKVDIEGAGQAIEMLARNGVALDDILGGVTESTVLLSNATGGGLAQSADIMTDAMAIFKIETENAMEAVNGMVSVTTASKFSIDDYALALAQGGGVAAAAGVEFDDFNTTMAAISPLFGSGSDAGTSFKVMLQRLVPASEKATELMQDLDLIGLRTNDTLQFITDQGMAGLIDSSVSLEDALLRTLQATGNLEDGITTTDSEFIELSSSLGLLGNRFFDAEGQMVAMDQVAGLMSETFGDMSEEARNAALSTIFGTDAMRAAVGLAEVGADGFSELAASMSETDAAAAGMTRMDTLKGQLEILRDSVTGFAVSLVDRMTPALRSLVDGAVSSFNTFSGVVDKFISNIELGIDPITALHSALSGLVPESMLAALRNLRDNILPSLTSWFEENITPITNFVAANVQLQDVLIALGVAIGAALIPVLLTLVTTIAPIVLAVGALVGVVALARTAWEENWGGIQERTAAAWAAIQPHLIAARDWLAVNLPIALETLRAWWVDTAWPAIQNAMTIAWPVIQQIFGLIVEGLKVLSTAVLNFAQWYAERWTHAQTINKNVWTVIKGIWEELGRWINDNLVPWVDYLSVKFSESWANIQAKIQEAWSVILPIFEPLLDWMQTKLPAGTSTAFSAFNSTFPAIADMVGRVKDFVIELTSAARGLWDWLSSHTFEFKINLPDLPDWAVPGSPIPLHTAWKDFASDMNNMRIEPQMNLAGVASGGGRTTNTNNNVSFAIDARGQNSNAVSELERMINRVLDDRGLSVDRRRR